MSIEQLVDNLRQQLAGSQHLDKAQVEEWRELYPYFSLPLLLYVRNNRNKDVAAMSLSNIYVSDGYQWARQIGLLDDFSDMQPRNAAVAGETTDGAIDLFLSTYGKGQDCEPYVLITDEAQEKSVPTASDSLIAIPAYDYMSELDAMPDAEDSVPLQGSDLLDRFLEAEAAGEQMFSKSEFNTPVVAPVIENENIDDNEALFSESLAKVYIQQRRYSKALEIIRKLSLNNPEKNIYFADQIRFLEKLIINVKN